MHMHMSAHTVICQSITAPPPNTLFPFLYVRVVASYDSAAAIIVSSQLSVSSSHSTSDARIPIVNICTVLRYPCDLLNMWILLVTHHNSMHLAVECNRQCSRHSTQSWHDNEMAFSYCPRCNCSLGLLVHLLHCTSSMVQAATSSLRVVVHCLFCNAPLQQNNVSYMGPPFIEMLLAPKQNVMRVYHV